MNICVVGTGYVGLVTGACFAEFGVNVTCVDKDSAKVRQLREGKIPIYEPGLGELVAKGIRAGRLRFSDDLAEAVRSSLVLFIAVGTPPRGDGSTDLRYVDEVAEAIARHLDGYKLVVTKSTVPVGTGRRIREIIARTRRENVEFDVAANPEFLREGAAIEDFLRPNRVVIGAESPQAVAILKDLYRPLYLLETPFVLTDVPTAELIKYAANAFLATKISFINELARLAEALGVDVHQVAVAMGLDNRIGKKFLHPGPGFGGSCFPKDLSALVQLGREHDVELGVVEASLAANARQRAWAVGKIEAAAGGVAGKAVGVLGLAFKPNTDDIREAPAMAIVGELRARGARVCAYDPEAMPRAREVFADLDCRADAYAVAEGADALVVVTEWNEFRNLDLERLRGLMARPVLVDLRNVYDPAKARALGFTYHGVGRP
ncbi:MAG TPA: UDP-glucose/GDP-mannose dehydrogenase family protein [Candidatus Methylomirabilis sp.]|jgi:UDPglucose 6-dehydrogenase